MNIGEIVREVEALPVEMPEQFPLEERPAPEEIPAAEPAAPAAA